jgi:hypothetical protein
MVVVTAAQLPQGPQLAVPRSFTAPEITRLSPQVALAYAYDMSYI